MKKFIITGIQMRNKGSQAMFLSLSYSLKSVYGDCEVIGFANKYDDPEQYNFALLPYDNYTRFVIKYRLNSVPFLEPILTGFVARLKGSDKWHKKIPEIRNALLEADAIFDASGYTLGSGWPKQSGTILLDTIRMARRYNKKIILMPQSFGPFDWGEKGDIEFVNKAKKELAYPLKIFAREREGYECLSSLGLHNVELSADMVIRERPFPKTCQVYMEPKDNEDIYPTQNSVGFILNKNVLRFGDPSAVIDLYARMLEQLIGLGENVFILNTSTADTELVNQVIKRIDNTENVHLISGEYSGPELIDIISRFKFVVASRYHSVVFAYRSGVPAVILGWASKYTDLAALFEQEGYVFDIRCPDVEQILEGVKKMGTSYEDEAKRIRERLEDVQASSVVLQAVRALDA